MDKARFKTWTPKVTVTAQGNLLKLSVGVKSQIFGVAPRGRVSEFSHQSRKRMLETLARVDFRRAGFVSFITLTYPDGDGPPTAQRTSRDRNSFCKRLNRRFIDASSTPRASGVVNGKSGSPEPTQRRCIRTFTCSASISPLSRTRM